MRAHRLGSDPAGDVELFSERDPAFFLSIGKTLDHRLLLIVSGTTKSRETWLLDADEPLGEPRLVAPRRNGHRYSVDHAHGRLWIRTDDRHPNFRLVSAPVGDPGEASWREEIPADDLTYLVEHECFADFCVLRDAATGGRRCTCASGTGPSTPSISASRPGPRSSATIASSRPTGVRLSYSSMVTPPTVLDYVPRERRLIARKVQTIPTGYEPGDYVCETLSATAPDGAEIPITLLRRRDLSPRAPLFLYGYGAYGHGLDASFVSSRLSLVDRGFAYALAHVRGGDEKARLGGMPASSRPNPTASAISSPAPRP